MLSLIMAVCLTWTLTTTLDDDNLNWPSVDEAVAYQVFRVVGEELILMGRVVAPTTALIIGDHPDAEFCVKAEDTEGLLSAGCAFYEWERIPGTEALGEDATGRFMDVSRRSCGAACTICIEWEPCSFEAEHPCCVESIVVEGVDCCEQSVCE